MPRLRAARVGAQQREKQARWNREGQPDAGYMITTEEDWDDPGCRPGTCQTCDEQRQEDNDD